VVGVKSETATKLRLAKWRYAPAAAILADEELSERQIEATDQQIDELVYDLYGARPLAKAKTLWVLETRRV
jgi:hypothetical protein